MVLALLATLWLLNQILTLRSECCYWLMQAVEGAPLPPLAEGEVSSFANWIKLLHSKGSEACPQILHGLMLLYLVWLCIQPTYTLWWSAAGAASC